MEGKFSLFEQKEVTNKELNINYKPSTSVAKYTYRVYNEKEVVTEVTIPSNKETTIKLTETGNYHIEVTTETKAKQQHIDKSGIYHIDMDKPVISVSGNILVMNQLKNGEVLSKEDLIGILKVYDKQDGDLFKDVVCDFENINYSKVGLYDLNCNVFDSAGNITSTTIKFNVRKSNTAMILSMQIIFIIVLFVTIAFLLRYRKALNYTKRIIKYSVESLNDKKLSLFENIKKIIQTQVGKINKYVSKSRVLKKHSKKYDKYYSLYRDLYKDSMEFMSFKIWVAMIFTLVTLFAKTISLKMPTMGEIFIPILLGFIIPDVVYKIRYKVYRKKLENDLLQAITIMNNAFKSGRSIVQAIELVSHELKGPMSEEFRKMHLELSFGLSIEDVFKRFSERIQIEEVTYLTASLSILNKTGGNIIKVFTSIEKTMFDKKKLKLQLASLTGASKIIVWVLFLVPFLFVAFIMIISPTYFEPFYKTTLGLFLLGIIAFIYMLYIWLVRKIMKVRM